MNKQQQTIKSMADDTEQVGLGNITFNGWPGRIGITLTLRQSKGRRI